MLRLAVLLLIFMTTAAVSETPMHKLIDQERRALNAISKDRLAGMLKKPGADVTYSRAWLDVQKVTKGDAQWQCLSEALYFEARGESVTGQFAVGEVILNRVDSAEFPNTVCKVINQGTGRKFACQFTYTCDGRKEVISEPVAYDRVGKVAYMLLKGAPRNLTQGATYYHTRSVSPGWARKFLRTATIGVHYFYRQPTRVSLN